MITTILSGGEAGVEQAALDAAMRLSLQYGGWTSHVHPDDEARVMKYNLMVSANQNYAGAVKQNIEEADGILIIAKGKLIGAQELVERLVRSFYKPYLRLDMGIMSLPYACRMLKQWCMSNWVKVLYVTGASAAEDQEIYEQTVMVLEAALKKG